MGRGAEEVVATKYDGVRRGARVHTRRKAKGHGQTMNNRTLLRVIALLLHHGRAPCSHNQAVNVSRQSPLFSLSLPPWIKVPAPPPLRAIIMSRWLAQIEVIVYYRTSPNLFPNSLPSPFFSPFFPFRRMLLLKKQCGIILLKFLRSPREHLAYYFIFS